MKKHFISLVIGLLIVLCLSLFLVRYAYAANVLYVTASELNGRAMPNRHSSVEAIFEKGWDLVPTGNVKGNWVEVYGGETGTVWCSADYLSEINEPVVFENISSGRVRSRTTPNGKARGWVHSNESVTVTRIVNGWGYVEDCGWVSLEYFIEKVDE